MGAVPIDGDRSLPPGYSHPHASERARAIAAAGMILRVQVGSGVHGITVDGGMTIGTRWRSASSRQSTSSVWRAFPTLWARWRARTNRPELVAVHGFDTKFAAHALRLGIQGVEVLTLGRMNLPMLDEHRDHLRAIRRGQVPLRNVLDDIGRYERRLIELKRSSDVPDQPDRRWADDWLIRSYLDFWRDASSIHS